jgi:uncharacterized protein YggU (UPF0235/DUF167 family)
VELTGSGVTIRVASAPVDGRATQEARALLADSLGVPISRISLRAGARSRSKLFDVEGLDEAGMRARLSPEGRGV